MTQAKKLVARRIPVSHDRSTGMFDKLVKMKYDIPNDELEMFDEYIPQMIDQARSAASRCTSVKEERCI